MAGKLNKVLLSERFMDKNHNLSGIVKSVRDIMRKDAGVDGDAQRISQMVWTIFLKVFDTMEEERERQKTKTTIALYLKRLDGEIGPQILKV